MTVVSNLIIYQWTHCPAVQSIRSLLQENLYPYYRRTFGFGSAAIIPGGGRPAEHPPEHFPMSSGREVSPFSDLHFLNGFPDNLREVLFSASLS